MIIQKLFASSNCKVLYDTVDLLLLLVVDIADGLVLLVDISGSKEMPF